MENTAFEKALQEERIKFAKALQEERAKHEQILGEHMEASKNLILFETERIRSHLSYRLGKEILQSNSVFRVINLPWRIFKAYSDFTEKKISFKKIKGNKSSYSVVALIEKQLSLGVNELDEGEYATYIKSLYACKEFQKCIDLFEQRYGNAELFRLHDLRPGVLDAYVKSLLRLDRWEFALQLAKSLTNRYSGQGKYWSLLGFIQVGQQPSEARMALRNAIQLGSKVTSDVPLIFGSLLKENRPLQEIESDLNALSGRHSLSKAMKDNLSFLRSSVALNQGNDEAALNELNAYFSRYGLTSLKFCGAQKIFGINSFLAAEKVRPVKKGPLLSILMTTYNSAEFLDVAISSVTGQTYGNLELLVVDDCSSDSTREKLEEWKKRDSRVRIFHNLNNVGTYASKNLALLFARGEFITCHDSDDWSHPQKLALQMDYLLSSNAVACTTSWIRMNERGYFEPTRWGALVHINPSSFLYRREVVETVGYYDSVKVGADSEFQQRVIHQYGTDVVAHIPLCLAFGRSHPESLTRSGSTGFGQFGESPLRQQYWGSWGSWHRQVLNDSEQRFYIPFPPEQARTFTAPSEILTTSELINENIRAATVGLSAKEFITN
jgi:hypothetical protein